jgi:hypothetical protein
VVEAFVAPFAAAYAGVGWERINFDWPSLQPTGPASWNKAAVSGAMINGEIAAGREIVGLIGGRPRWALDARGLPRGLYLPPDDPRNLWVEPGSIPNPKDAVENKLNQAVCSNLIPLATAQRAIATNWVTAFDAAGLRVSDNKVCLRQDPSRCASGRHGDSD